MEYSRDRRVLLMEKKKIQTQQIFITMVRIKILLIYLGLSFYYDNENKNNGLG